MLRDMRRDELTTEILLSSGEVALIDTSDLYLIKDYHWHKYGRYVGSNTKSRRTILMHRLVIGVPPQGHKNHVDHINGDGLDNRRSNLRLCSPSDNQHNSTKRKDNTTGYKGVCKTKNGTFRAYIFFEGKQRNLGRAQTPEEAANLYDEGAKKYYGEYARLNYES